MSELLVVCSVCSRKKLYINPSKRVGWCHYCSKALSPSEVQPFLKGVVSSGPRALSKLPELIDAWEVRDARAFLQSRAVGRMECPVVEYDPEGRRLYFRIWSPSPELPVTYHTRSIDPGGTWRMQGGSTKGGYFFGRVAKRRACIVEGIWDAIRIGPGALAILGSSMSTTQETYLRNAFTKVLVYMDPDEAGQKAQKEILSRLNKIGVKCAAMVGADKEPADYPPGHPVIEDVQDWLRKD